MNPEFWHDKWANNEIAFHQGDVHALLAKHWAQFNVEKSSRIFVPLCGKTLDIAWLLAQGHQVVAIELSQLAVEQLFEDLDAKPDIVVDGDLTRYQAGNLTVFVGDIFNLSAEQVGRVDAIYDRAALVALPVELRLQYSTHLKQISHQAPQFVICFDYDQSVMNGPPFSITSEELNQHYQTDYQLSLIESIDVAGGLKGKATALENVWFLKPSI